MYTCIYGEYICFAHRTGQLWVQSTTLSVSGHHTCIHREIFAMASASLYEVLLSIQRFLTAHRANARAEDLELVEKAQCASFSQQIAAYDHIDVHTSTQLLAAIDSGP